MRLQQFIVSAGLASRRKAEQLVRSGQVTVNGRTVKDPVVDVEPKRDHVRVAGRIADLEERVTIILNKPRGFVTTLSDPEGRHTVGDLVRGVGVRVVPVGRLDYHTQGVLLLTNDGELAHALMHPSFEIERVYQAKLKGHVAQHAMDMLRRGVTLEDGPARADRVRILTSSGRHTWVEIAMHEGRNRQIHRMAFRIGHPVIRLHRVRFAGLTCEGLAPGQWRVLRKTELARLKTRGCPAISGRGGRSPQQGSRGAEEEAYWKYGDDERRGEPPRGQVRRREK